VQFVVESARVADRIAVGVPPPQRGGRRCTVDTAHPAAPTHRLPTNHATTTSGHSIATSGASPPALVTPAASGVPGTQREEGHKLP